MQEYTPRDWYWVVDGSITQVFHSARAAFVSTSDAIYQAWVAQGNKPTNIDTTANLFDVFDLAGVLSARIEAALTEAGGLRPDQVLKARLASGVTVVSTGNSGAYNGVYSIDLAAQQKYQAIADGISAGKGLPHGASTVGLADFNGVPHAFDSAGYLNLAKAIEDHVYDLYATEAALLAGGSAAWPAPQITIP